MIKVVENGRNTFNYNPGFADGFQRFGLLPLSKSQENFEILIGYSKLEYGKLQTR